MRSVGEGDRAAVEGATPRKSLRTIFVVGPLRLAAARRSTSPTLRMGEESKGADFDPLYQLARYRFTPLFQQIIEVCGVVEQQPLGVVAYKIALSVRGQIFRWRFAVDAREKKCRHELRRACLEVRQGLPRSTPSR